MSRWVEEEWLLDYFADDIDYYGKYVREDIKDNMPSIEIIRYSECKHASDNKVYGCMLNHFNDNDYDYHRMYANDFCSYGEREDE